MKKPLFLLVVALFVSTFSFAGNSSFFTDDLNAIESEFASLSNLEQQVITNPALTFAQAMESNLVSNDFKLLNGADAVANNLVFEWEGFLWGFLCCPIGLFVVALNDNKTPDNKTSYWIGVAAGTVLSLLTSPTYVTYY
jgi:hypothetical protein